MRDDTSPNPVLKSLQPVIRNSQHVTINLGKIKEASRSLTDEQLGLSMSSWWHQPVFMGEDSKRTIDFFMLGNAVDFKFWDSENPDLKYSTEYKGELWDDAFGLWAALSRALDEGKPLLDARYLATISDAEVEETFRGTVPLPIIAQRAEILREVGRVLKEKYGGHFYNLVSEARYRAFDNGNGIVERLTRDFPSYNDVTHYGADEITFYKRAQLAVGMLYNRLKGAGLFDIKDIDELTVFADYQLPKVLRSMGILEYSDSLAEKVDNRTQIEKDSAEEVEIRAHTVYAADLLLKEINSLRESQGKDPVNALNLDYCLWRKGLSDTYSYHHLTETTAY